MLGFLYPPILELPLAIILLLLIITIPLIVIYLFLRLTEAAFEEIGFDHWHATLAVFGSFIGSLINIPLYAGTISSYPGWYITLASIFAPGFPTTFHPLYLAINVGGAIVPLIISAHLVLTRRVSASKAGAGILVVALITYVLAQPVAGKGIVLPFWVSPVLAVICSLVLLRGYCGAPSLAYISGSIGTLLGADVMNILTPGVLPALSPVGLQTSKSLVLSIGGAGVFDGIFLTGILAVLFASGIVRFFHGSCEGVRMHRNT
ncbi:hypothetical protein MSBR3_0400 [Methanosarcina barkeri 3]|uniref:DUF1614 domain-containing protein n=1 Tax=Methanosarcina barkeri 3 TaxID=1434107 RepID=A0A0E3SKF2_METBA|nr:DUF1614 domain-containing protein [Methanosarcina barkeri]AKB80978.1 hypothetical protein MSBR3_0400 [Methanosarcina barkeri 3]